MSAQIPKHVIEAQQVLVIGAGHGIGFALVAALASRHPNIQLVATYSNQQRAQSLLELAANAQNLKTYCLDHQSETAIAAFCQSTQAEHDYSFDIVIQCCGALHSEQLTPEKSLSDIDSNQLLEYFNINAIGPLLFAKHLVPMFAKNKTCVYVNLSAKVGSIEDNQLGGWYGYRASKAALNMFVKNIAIEYKAKHLDVITVAVHPGTTKTQLSESYLSHIKHRVVEASETADCILNVIGSLTPQDNGTFLNWDGTQLPW